MGEPGHETAYAPDLRDLRLGRHDHLHELPHALPLHAHGPPTTDTQGYAGEPGDAR